MAIDVFGFVFQHTDNCPECSQGNFCHTGLALMRRAANMGAEMLCPIPPVPKGKAQA